MNQIILDAFGFSRLHVSPFKCCHMPDPLPSSTRACEVGLGIITSFLWIRNLVQIRGVQLVRCARLTQTAALLIDLLIVPGEGRTAAFLVFVVV